MVEKQPDSNSDIEDKAGQHSNMLMIFLVVFVLLPVTVIFVTEIATDKLIYRTISENYLNNVEN